jgi:hypothetical protein
LLCNSCCRQRDPDVRRGTQSEFEILLVKPDPEAGIGCTFDHPQAVDVQHTRTRKSRRDRPTNSDRVGAKFGCENRRFTDGLDVEGDDDPVGDLGSLSRAILGDQLMVLPNNSRTGRAASNALSGPPTMMVRVPDLAPISAPETGASR